MQAAPNADALKAAVASAIRFFDDSREPPALLWLERMHRRFHVPAFADALQRFDRVLAEESPEAPKLRLFRRIADPDNPLRLDDLQSVSHPSDGIIVSALYCDRLDLPDSFADVLAKAVRTGGYYCTHALLAWVWLQEYGGRIAVSQGFADELFEANAAIVNVRTSEVTDLKLEAAAFLHLAGEGRRVDPAFVRAVIRTQNPDGGWGMTRAKPGSDWHGTVLALLLLLHAQETLDA